jgi:hypothetical protein
VLGESAARNPKRFMAYIHAPRLIDPAAKMPGNDTYNAAALAALTAYFQTFSSEGSLSFSVEPIPSSRGQP